MIRDNLIEKMKKAEKEFGDDYEALHAKHDALLLEYINDKRVTEIFKRTPKWCE